MASDKLFSTIITIIIIVLVLIIAIWGVAKLNSAGMLDDLFPNFGKDKRPVKWDEKYFFSYPGEILYEFNSLLVRYNVPVEGGVLGWEWKEKQGFFGGKEQIYLRADREIAHFHDLDDKKKEFVRSLAGKSSEQGLEQIVNYVITNKERLIVSIDSWEESYGYDDKRLVDLNSLIIKYNQISRGVSNK